VKLRGLGAGGDDVISGGNRGDILVGGPGNDDLTGGAGRDIFHLRPGHGHDRVADFTSGEDLLRFQGVSADQVHWEAAGQGGEWGLLVTYGPGGDTVFLAGVGSLAAGDLAFV
jgi:Ca2+-binding RTX toxin-like protein